MNSSTHHNLTPSIPNAIAARIDAMDDIFEVETYTAKAMRCWLMERCYFANGVATSFADLHADWLRWADINDEFRSTGRKLANALVYLRLPRTRVRSGTVRAYVGIALQSGGVV